MPIFQMERSKEVSVGFRWTSAHKHGLAFDSADFLARFLQYLSKLYI